MVNLADAPPQPPHEEIPNLSTGRSLSPRPGDGMMLRTSSSRRRSLSEATGQQEHAKRRLRFSSLSYSGTELQSGSFSASSSRRTRFSSRSSMRDSTSSHEEHHHSIEEGRRSRFSSRSSVRESTTFEEDEQDVPEDHSQEHDGTVEGDARMDDTSESQQNRPRRHSDGESFMTTTDFDEDDDTLRNFMSKRRAPSTTDTAPQQKYICGRPLPLWCTTKPKATTIATFLAKYAPCFWCSRESLSLTTTNQAILLRLNALTALFALLQVASMAFLCFVLFNDALLDRTAYYVNRGRRGELVNTPNLWSTNGSILATGALGAFTFIGMICSRRSLREIDLPGSLRFMWFLLWIIPIQVYLFITLFDYHNVTNVWIKHWWTAESTAWYRWKTCAGGTYQTLCVVPIDGLPLFDSEDEWCEFYYNTTACEPIRNSAQVNAATFAQAFNTVNGILGVVVFLLLVLIVKVLEGVITKPIMQKSRERNIPMWLTLPFAGCLATGCVLLFSPTSILKYNTNATKSWPGVAYLVAGALYGVAAILGYCISKFAILNTRDKHTKSFMVLLFIVLMLISVATMMTVFVGSVLLSTSYVDTTIDDQLRGSLACSISPGSCSYCGNNQGLRECPEWSDSDVTKVIKTQLKASAVLAMLFMFYSLGALRFGINLRHHISMYQIDYV